MKRVCPPLVRDIVLTEDIKEAVLRARIYKVKDEAKITTQTINNNHTIHNYIAGLDVVAKINELSNFRNKPLLGFETKVEELYEGDVERYQTDSFKGVVRYEKQHFMNMIHEVTRSRNNDMDDLSVFYNREDDRIYFAAGEGRWDDYMCDPGIHYLIDTLVSYNLEEYEAYLIRKLESRSTLGEFKSSLEDYYGFIAVFDVDPWVRNKSDADLMDSVRFEGNEIACSYMDIYKRVKEGLTDIQRKTTARMVIDVIKTTTKTNVRELNKRIMSILNLDDGFKRAMLQLS